jgi:hypothetical protein
MDQFAGDEGITTEKYETMSIDRHLTPATFYGMDITTDKYESVSYTGGSARYKVVSLTDEISRVEVDINGKIYNVEVPIIKSKKGSDKIDQTYLIGVIENIINPC